MIPYVEINGWHIELTRRCPLACPACNRTMDNVPKVVDPKKDIDTNILYNFFTDEVLAKTEFVLLQGNLGDPIYHPEFHKISEHFFNVKLLSTVTNGMHNLSFWERVLRTWPKNSKITFSIDGLRDSNFIYRVNSKWDRIAEIFNLISTTPRQCKLNWKYIVFEHNKHQVDEATALSKKIGFDEFQIQRSRLIDPDSNIKPYYGSDIFYKPISLSNHQLDPYCFSGDMHYIDAFGMYYPCCWWPDVSPISHGWTPIDISTNTFSDLNAHFGCFKDSIVWEPKTCPSCCAKMCKMQTDNYENLMSNTQLGRIVITHD